MFSGISVTEVKNRPLIEIPRPKMRLDGNGNPVEKDGQVQFDVKAEKIDFEISKSSPVKKIFYEHYIIDGTRRVKSLELAVFFYLAGTTEWSVVQIIVDTNNNPLLTSEGRGRGVIKTFGNRSATKTISEIASAVDASYGAIQKALTFWEAQGLIKRISEYKKKGKSDIVESGRPVEHRRYEFDPTYVWNGHIWAGNGYEAYLLSEACTSIDTVVHS